MGNGHRVGEMRIAAVISYVLVVLVRLNIVEDAVAQEHRRIQPTTNRSEPGHGREVESYG